MDRRKFIAATCSTLGMSAIGMPALAQAKTKIRVGYLHTLAVDGQIWLAEHLGAWAKNGLDPQFKEFKTGIKLFTDMSGGSIDMLTTGAVISNFPARGQGKKLLDAGAYYPSAAVVGGWATTAAYHASNRPVLTRIIKGWTEGNDMLIARSNESLDILHKNYYPQVPDRDIREQFGAMRVFPTAVWRRLYSNGTITEWLQQVTDFYTRVAKIENPLTAAQYFDPSIFLSVIKQ